MNGIYKRKIIIGAEGCGRCKMLAETNPDAELIKLPNDVLLAFAKETNIMSLPFVVIVDDQAGLDKILKGE